MRRNLHWVVLTAALLLVGLLIACAINPVTGKRELMLLSESDEVALGQQTDQEIAQTYGIYEDAALNSYVQTIGVRMGKLSHRPQLAYQIKVLDTPVVNAFAVPGGYVYVTRGIMAYLNDEAELAGVLGHEIGHVAARHTAKEYSKQQLAQLGLGVGYILSEKFRQYAGIANFGVSLLFLKFSRDNEREADNLGVEYSSKSGYDAARMASFFETLERMSDGGSGSGLPEFFSTHPNPENRLVAVRSRAKEWQTKLPGTTFAVNRQEYLNRVNGITFGEDPRQGYVDSNVFYHPTLKFQFAVPAQWTVNNTPAQVQMVAPKEDASLIFTLQSNASAQNVAKEFVSGASASVSRSDAVTINGMQAQRLVSQVVSESDTLGVLSWFIQKGADVYIFHGLSAPDNQKAYTSSFTGAVGQFKSLSDARRINVAPKTLQVQAGKNTTNLSALLMARGVVQTELEPHAVMNGMQLTDSVPAGTLIKSIK